MDVTVHHTAAQNESAYFKHDPLDHTKPSIRLVHLLPSLSPNGRIQCSVMQSTVDADYICLSYRWGNPAPSKKISIDGKDFAIRQNLFDFLTAARENHASSTPATLGPYWIDALCIDQSNVLERNHQVRQMGTIYTNALRVYVWLGMMIWDRRTLVPVLKKAKATENEWRTFTDNKDVLIQRVLDNDYWTRAWIVQEVALARQVTLWLGAASIGLSSMVQGLDYICYADKEIQSRLIFRLGRSWQKEFYKNKSLVHLLDYFRDQQCSDVRDRIFSLLSLVTGDGRDLKVNYHVSRAELAAEVLRQCQGSLCFCTALLVVQTLELGTTDLLCVKPDRRLLPCLEFCIEYISASSAFLPGAESQSRKWPAGFSFSDTCESVTLFPARLNRYLKYWIHTGPVEQPLSQKDGVVFRPAEGWENIYIVRISLPFLATMITHSVDICVHAKSESARSGLPAGYPRICYASDHMEQPGTAEPSSQWTRDDAVQSVPKRKRRPEKNDGWFREDAVQWSPKRKNRRVE
ncbi:heterokaryon incompatibility protein-domain-containing protein [Alternaria rosae]|uniref:heterokaryon incompatibility protein-domain-containing protein n=1 Tax=Alternaria rosae TaxID=1187941 RepID=UPI001E8EDF8D|nr:heterokaryon incompatibility protein-domain-containing protein [Alternaria rosae]KAH6882544.1 heterokaryon incompatibility protein-domain-containing protein [Alternaria rosae]